MNTHDLTSPPAAAPAPVEARFRAALDALVTQLRDDRSVLAAILCGSLSHDTVWERSDIDLVLVTADDRGAERGSVALYADGVHVHAMLLPRAEFRRAVGGAVGNSFTHSFLAKGRLLYTHDETVAELCAQLGAEAGKVGGRDTRVQLLRAGLGALGPLYKARKWLVTRGDADYASLWLLYAATPLAQVEVVGRRLLADREVLVQATALNPAFFRTVYTDLLGGEKTPGRVRLALEGAERYLAERAATLFAPVIEYLRDAGEARSCTEIDSHFARTLDVSGVTLACEYLADEGRLGRASTPARLTKRSNVEVQELAFVYL